MRDVVAFESPFGLLGRIVDALVLSRYLARLIEQRNRIIKDAAEHG